MEPTAEISAETRPLTIKKRWPMVAGFVKTHGKTIAVVLVIIFLASAYLHQVQATNVLKQQGQNASTSAQSQATQLRNQVARLIQLPTGETPTIATVTDATKLQNQAFFANAQNGDKVLMFAQAKEVILYRPGTNRIIQVAPLNPGGASSANPAGQTGSSQ